MINRKQLHGEMLFNVFLCSVGSYLCINVVIAYVLFTVKQCMVQCVSLPSEEWQDLDSYPCLLNIFSEV